MFTMFVKSQNTENKINLKNLTPLSARRNYFSLHFIIPESTHDIHIQTFWLGYCVKR